MTLPAPARLTPEQVVAHADTFAPSYADARALHAHIRALEEERSALIAGIVRALNEALPVEDLLQPIQTHYHGKEQWANDYADVGEHGALHEALMRSINTAGELFRLLSAEERTAWMASYDPDEPPGGEESPS